VYAKPVETLSARGRHAILNINDPEWRNWQTQQTQNLPGITPRVGSTPSSGTIILHLLELAFLSIPRGLPSSFDSCVQSF
jgi:hypothetical protein